MRRRTRMRGRRIELIEIHGTTICAVRKDGAGDGQATQTGQNGGGMVIKGNCHKVRRIYNGSIISGFAGSTADAFTLFELFEGKLKQFNGDLMRASVELAKQWRTDKALRNFDAMLLASDGSNMLLISGNGDVLDPDGDAIAIGSGGYFALSAARAYLDAGVDWSAEEIARRSVGIAADICVYTNHNIITEVQDARA